MCLACLVMHKVPVIEENRILAASEFVYFNVCSYHTVGLTRAGDDELKVAYVMLMVRSDDSVSFNVLRPLEVFFRGTVR